MIESPSIAAQLAATQRALITPEVLYFPVRHHSPACAWQIQRWIRQHRPRAVLIEAPDDFQPLLPHLLHEKCVPPVAIYTHFRLGGKTEQADDERHAAYYPLAAYSPEWVALREGHAVGAEVRFIDLDYASQQQVEREATAQPGALKIESLQMEQHFRRSAYLREVARRLGCRDHDELWDHLIEVRSRERSVEDVVADVAAYCFFSRQDTPSEVLQADGTVAREAVMAAAIRETLDRGSAGDARPVLVVTGGFHSVVLPELVSHLPPPPKRHTPITRQSCLTRYTFAQLDALSGYAAGMPQPGYYQSVWESLQQNDDAPLKAVALQMIVRLGQAARSRDLAASISVADEIAALEQALRLAQIREHPGPSREDIWDAIRGCLVKGELGADGEAILALARKLFTGEATGQLPPDAGVPPLVEDFRRVAQLRKLPIAFGAMQPVSLEIYKKEMHRETSRFLHRLEFLSVPYGQRRAGPDFLRGFDLRRVIEHWDCQWIPQTESKLIECSAYGASVEEAASARLREEAARLDDESADGASSGVALLIRACLMGLPAAATDLARRLTEWVGRDASFVSVARAFGQLMLLWQSREPLEASRLSLLPMLMQTAYVRACQILGGGVPVPEEEAETVLNGCMLMNSRLAAGDDAAGLDPELFWQSLASLFPATNATPPLLRGGMAGLLHSAGRMDVEAVMKAVQGALSPAVGEGARQVDFLAGLLKTARELAWREPRLLAAVEALFAQWDEEEFLHRLPHLRLAWSDLTPRETDQVAARVAEIHGVEKRTLTAVSSFGEGEVLHALGVFARVEKSLLEDGLAAWLEAAAPTTP